MGNTKDTSHKFAVKESTLIIIAALFFASFENIAFWKKALELTALDSMQNILFLASLLTFFVCFFILFFSVLLWRPLTKPLLIVLLLISAGANYFSISYGIYIDREMIRNVSRTNAHETLALITPQFLLWFTLLGILPAILVWKVRITPARSALRGIAARIFGMAAAVALIGITAVPMYKDYASFFRNNKDIVKLIAPTNFIHGSYAFAKQTIRANQPLLQIGLDAKQVFPDEGAHKPTLFVLVVGETARAANFSLFGYERNTNPLLSQQNNLLAFQHTSSCGTATATSVPCMFSNMARVNYSSDLADRQENLVDILSRAGVSVLWNENNTGCQDVCNRLPLSVPIAAFTPSEDCPEGLCYDEHLLDNVSQYIAEQKNGDIFIVLHTIGSHGPSYYRRYPPAMPGQFTPPCDTNQIQGCSKESLVNTYDNTIVYTDYMLNQTIELLKGYEDRYETGMLYVSDHGESLGESGMYLHSAPYMIAPSEQTHVPMIFWSSDEFMQKRRIDLACMQQNARDKEYSHDNLFHTMLGAMHVSTVEYKPELDLFSECRR